jgi:hypothetical protein
MLKKNVEVWCTLQLEATHNWPECPFEEVDYLRVPHRHLFFIKAYANVHHDDRDVEFIKLKHSVTEYLKEHYWNEQKKLHVLGKTSCEMLASELCTVFNLSRCEVSEDNENGAIVTLTELE